MKKNQLWKRFLAIFLIVSLTLSLSLPVKAASEGAGEGEPAGEQSNIINGSFEDPDNKSQDTKDLGYKYTSQNDISGWKTTSTKGTIELGWMNKDGKTSVHMKPTLVTAITSGVGASDGWKFAETIGNENSTIYQSLQLYEGIHRWTVHHRGRNGVDTLALFLVDDANINYVKSSKTNPDHFSQIITWMKDQGISAPGKGEMASYTVYTTDWLESNAFAESGDGSFSFSHDDDHTVPVEVYLMSSDKSNWGEYTGEYLADGDKNILFAMTCFNSASSKDTSGNLVDNLSFFNMEGENLLNNPGFEDVVISGKYYMANAANSTSPHKNIGWCTTASDYKVEIGNLKEGDAYGLGVTLDIIEYNAPSIRDGNQFAELNADQESSLYQIVDTEPGKMYRWSLSHRGRDGLDTMALVIGPDQPYEPKKAEQAATARDQLMQIVDWLKIQNDVVLDITDQGCSDEIKLYTPKFNSDGGFELDSNIFSWYQDETHTEEWSVWIISSLNDKWHDYGAVDETADYSYDYIVPAGHANTIFGFVSVSSAPKASDGKIDKTYGNLLDHIAFQEYYYVNADFDGNEDVGYVYIESDEEGTLISDDESRDTGWAFAGSGITINFQPGTRDFIGAYVNGEFVPKDDWTYDEEKGVYSYPYEVNSSLSVSVVYQARQVIYDSRNNYEYQYKYNEVDGTYSGGCEVPMGSGPDQLGEYISHAPEADDGWRFAGWRYIELHDNNSGENTLHRFEAIHKVKCDEDTSSGTKTLSIWTAEGTEPVVSGILYNDGILFIAEWNYRQRVIAQTFDEYTSQYEINSNGGTVEMKVAVGEGDEPVDYEYNSQAVGKELYAPSGDTYINVTAKNKTEFVFSGWYNSSGSLVSRNPSYTYKVTDGGVVDLYARFDPAGYDIVINDSVIGNSEDSEKYFAIDCSFSNLREDHVYAITGLMLDPIDFNGEQVTNHRILRSDDSGKANVTIYVKHGDTVSFKHLPEGCFYSVKANENSQPGFTVRGEASDRTLDAKTNIDFIWYKAIQASMIAAGKHYMDLLVSGEAVSVTPDSSYTFYAETEYVPDIYTTSLCFSNEEGAEQEFAEGTRILMIDKTNHQEPKFYAYTVNASTSEIPLADFYALGSTDCFVHSDTEDSLLVERLLFAVDCVAAVNPVSSGEISLVYHDKVNDKIISPEKKKVNIDEDATELMAAAGGGGNAANVGPFEINLTVLESYPVINTAYQGYDNGKYAVKLSLEGHTLPVGSCVEVDGTKYYSRNGYIKISPLSAGEITANLYLREPLAGLTGNKVIIKAELLSEVSTAASIPAEICKTVEFTCDDVGECAIDADISDKVLNPGTVSQLAATVDYIGIDTAVVTVAKKDGSIMHRSQPVTLPTAGSPFTIDFGDGFTAVSGETYILSFAGYANGVPVCRDTCCIVCGYTSE